MRKDESNHINYAFIVVLVVNLAIFMGIATVVVFGG